MTLTWRWYRLADMTGDLAERIFRLRQAVFIVEQHCLYQDIDGLDSGAHHLVGTASGGMVIAYCRVLAPGVLYPEPAIGRVVVDPDWRGRGAGRALMQEAGRFCTGHLDATAICLNAQQHLQEFYASMGYHPVRSPVLEDGIPHVLMRRSR